MIVKLSEIAADAILSSVGIPFAFLRVRTSADVAADFDSRLRSHFGGESLERFPIVVFRSIVSSERSLREVLAAGDRQSERR